MEKTEVFIGSSTEGLDVARALRDLLKDDAHVVVWNEGDFFHQNESILEGLLRVQERFDFAVIVYTPDDEVASRNWKGRAPRDNVVFEFGLFMGRLGQERTFLVHPKRKDLKIPSDFKNLICINYEEDPDRDLRELLGPGADEIRREIRRRGPYRDLASREAAVLYRLLNAFTPGYPDARASLLDFIDHHRPESIKYLSQVIDFSQELFVDYLYPHLLYSELKNLRLYFAFYLGDGVPFRDSDAKPRACLDRDGDGTEYEGEFVVGISNPLERQDSMGRHQPAEINWLRGKSFRGYSQGFPASNCALVFKTGQASYKSNINPQESHPSNHPVAGERAVYTVPVEWRSAQGTAQIGVLAVSSRKPQGIRKELRERVQNLATFLGYLFSLHVSHNQPELASAVIDSVIEDDEVPVGLSPDTSDQFVRRAIDLRQRIAMEFEEKLRFDGIHELRDGKLRVLLPQPS